MLAVLSELPEWFIAELLLNASGRLRCLLTDISLHRTLRLRALRGSITGYNSFGIPYVHPMLTKISFDCNLINLISNEQVREIIRISGRNLEWIDCGSLVAFHESPELLVFLADRCRRLKYLRLQSFFHQCKRAPRKDWEAAIEEIMKKCKIRSLDLRFGQFKFSRQFLERLSNDYCVTVKSS